MKYVLKIDCDDDCFVNFRGNQTSTLKILFVSEITGNIRRELIRVLKEITIDQKDDSQKQYSEEVRRYLKLILKSNQRLLTTFEFGGNRTVTFQEIFEPIYDMIVKV
jgi:hypothetical protein